MLVCKDADNAIRWQKGERLDHLFEQRCDALGAAGEAEHAAIVTDFETVSFRELDQRANRAARYLLAQGLTSGDRIGLLFDKTIETYVALLAVLKINAAYVPLDASFPTERVAFILEDARRQGDPVAVVVRRQAWPLRAAEDLPRCGLQRHRSAGS